MSTSKKAFLIIDYPEACADCPFSESDNYGAYICDRVNDYIDQYYYYKDRKHPDCPLRELPRLKTADEALDMKAKHSSMVDLNNTKNAINRFVDGWESALDELEGITR